MSTAIILAAIKLHKRPIVHINGKTYFWSAAAWQMVSAEEANAWGQLVPTQPSPWHVIVRHDLAARFRRQLAGQNDWSLLP